MSDTAPIEADLIWTSARVDRPVDGGVDVLREISAAIAYSGESGPEALGSISAWIGWNISEVDIYDVADAISADAAILGGAAAEIIEDRADLWIDSVLFVDRIYLEPRFRGNRLARKIVDDLLGLFRLNVESTVVVLHPEPQHPEAGPYPDGPERNAAMQKLTTAYRECGFEPWNDSAVWWLPIP